MRNMLIGLVTGCSVLLFSGVAALPQDTSLHVYHAVKLSDAKMLRQLAMDGLDFSQADEPEMGLMAEAAMTGTPELISVLAANGVNMNRADSMGYTPVMRALEAGRIDNARALRDLGATLKGVTEDGYTVRVLAENVGLKGFGPEYPSRPPGSSQEDTDQLLLLAAESGDVTTARFALANGASVNALVPANGWTAIMLAALSGNPEMVGLLADRGALGRTGHPWKTVGNGTDAVVAALVGEGGAEQTHERVVAILSTIEEHRPGILRGNADHYREAARNIGYSSSFLRQYLPQPFLPPVDFRITSPVPGGPDGWREVQSILKRAGYYDAAVDGLPGRQTLAGLSRYGADALKELHGRCETAAKRALDEYENHWSKFETPESGPLYLVAATTNGTTGSAKVWLGEFDVTIGAKDWRSAISESGFVLGLNFQSGKPTGDMACTGGPFDMRYHAPAAALQRVSFEIEVPDGRLQFTHEGRSILTVWRNNSGDVLGQHRIDPSPEAIEPRLKILKRLQNAFKGRMCGTTPIPIQFCTRMFKSNNSSLTLFEDLPEASWVNE